MRNQKCVTEYPAAGGDKPAPVLRKRYQYGALARVGYPGASAKPPASDWLVPTQESLCEVVGEVEQAELQLTTMSPTDTPTDLLRHGRPLRQTLLMGGKTTKTEFTYNKEVLNGHPVLVTEQKVTGFDNGELDGVTGEPRHVYKVITLKDSMLIGQPLLNRDDNNVEIEYEYDALRRVVRETVSPHERVAGWLRGKYLSQGGASESSSGDTC